MTLARNLAAFAATASASGTTGSAASATTAGSATSATTAGSATSATSATTAGSAGQLVSGLWTVSASGTKLTMYYNGTAVFSVDSSGNIISKADVTGYGTP